MTKLEEIALAIQRARYPDAPVMDTIECLGPTVQAQVLIEARAAVEVMRIPTMPMKNAGAPHLPVDNPAPLDAQHIWQAMIDAILNEKV